MHRLLKRQVKQALGKGFDSNTLDPKVLELLNSINETYDNFDKERNFLNHTAKENRKELKELYTGMITHSRLAGIGEMMENITHQWKQPLSIMLNLLSILKLEMKESRELQIITDQTRYLDKTINDFKNFSSHSDEEKRVFDLEKSIEETVELFRFQAELNHILVNLNVLKGLKLQGNIGRFNQVLLVIFSNSKDAFITKNISHRRVNLDVKYLNENITIEIKDNAGGISKTVIDKIFEPYFTTKFKDKGTGIGLSMVYNIVTKMGGTIEVKNHQGGALFTITLPKFDDKKGINE